MTMYRFGKVAARSAAALVLAASAAMTVGATDARAAATGPTAGCPDGAVCIYPRDAAFNGNRPSHALFSFGAHNLSNQFGNHIVFNNQVEGARARACTGRDGTGDCQKLPNAERPVIVDLTPINSIVLVPAERSGSGQLEAL
jgi:hypothetical protein